MHAFHILYMWPSNPVVRGAGLVVRLPACRGIHQQKNLHPELPLAESQINIWILKELWPFQNKGTIKYFSLFTLKFIWTKYTVLPLMHKTHSSCQYTQPLISHFSRGGVAFDWTNQLVTSQKYWGSRYTTSAVLKHCLECAATHCIFTEYIPLL